MMFCVAFLSWKFTQRQHKQVMITGVRTYHHICEMGIEDPLILVVPLVNLSEVCTEVIDDGIKLIGPVTI